MRATKVIEGKGAGAGSKRMTKTRDKKKQNSTFGNEGKKFPPSTHSRPYMIGEKRVIKV